MQVTRELFIDNLLVRIHFIIAMIRWTGLAPWGFEFPFPGSLTSTFLVRCKDEGCGPRTPNVNWIIQGYLAHKKLPSDAGDNILLGHHRIHEHGQDD